jgi:hypothetical protein
MALEEIVAPGANLAGCRREFRGRAEGYVRQSSPGIWPGQVVEERDPVGPLSHRQPGWQLQAAGAAAVATVWGHDWAAS